MLHTLIVNSFKIYIWKIRHRKENTRKNKRFNEKLVTELSNPWFIVFTKCPKHTWFLRNLEEKEAAAAEAVKTTVIKQAIIWALE